MSSFQQILNDPKPVLIDFYAEWCGPCKMMSPILKELKEKMGETLRIIKIDVDKNQQITSKYQVRGVPTLMLVKAGSVLWKQSGVMDVNSLKKTLQNVAALTVLVLLLNWRNHVQGRPCVFLINRLARPQYQEFLVRPWGRLTPLQQ